MAEICTHQRKMSAIKILLCFVSARDDDRYSKNYVEQTMSAIKIDDRPSRRIDASFIVHTNPAKLR